MLNQLDFDNDCQIAGLVDIYNSYFPHKRGTFVDVGAYDGVSFSNTLVLLHNSWRGVLYEPLKIPFDRMISTYNNKGYAFDAENIAIGAKDGMIDLWVAGEYQPLATTNKWVADINLWGDTYKYTLNVPCKTLNTALKSLKGCVSINPGFEVLNVDVEGSELAVLEGFDLEYWEPQMVIIELHEKHVDQRRAFQANTVNLLFDKHGYKKIHSDEVNTIFYRG